MMMGGELSVSTEYFFDTVSRWSFAVISGKTAFKQELNVRIPDINGAVESFADQV